MPLTINSYKKGF